MSKLHLVVEVPVPHYSVNYNKALKCTQGYAHMLMTLRVTCKIYLASLGLS